MGHLLAGVLHVGKSFVSLEIKLGNETGLHGLFSSTDKRIRHVAVFHILHKYKSKGSISNNSFKKIKPSQRSCSRQGPLGFSNWNIIISIGSGVSFEYEVVVKGNMLVVIRVKNGCHNDYADQPPKP